MEESWTFRIFWGGRRESAEECCTRLRNTLEGLAGCDSIFSAYLLGKNEPRVEVSDVKSEELLELVESGRNETAPPQMRKELGFSSSLWFEEASGSVVKLRVSCGAYNMGPSGPWNSATLSVRKKVLKRLMKNEKVLSILDVLIEAWEPNWGNLWTREVRKQLPDAPPGGPQVGWVLYLSSRAQSINILVPSSFEHERREDGVYIIPVDEPPSPDNPEDIERLRELHEFLGDSGLMEACRCRP